MIDPVAQHYSFGGLRDRIQQGLVSLGVAPSVDVLGPVDEFHVGGRPATAHLVNRLGLGASDHVLDIGSGLGGTARYLVTETGAHVTGIDLTPEYVEVATWLTELVGLEDHINFVLGSAAELPTPATPFTAATMVHVGMNIEDKASVFAQVAAALVPSARFAIYDMMATDDSQPDFPTPWAASDATSYLESAVAYQQILVTAGFEVEIVDDRTDSALAAFEQLAPSAAAGPPPLGLHLVMGPATPTKITNMVTAVRAGVIAPTEIIARRV